MLRSFEPEQSPHANSLAHEAAVVADRLAQATPHQIIEAAVNAMPGRLAVVSSFGTEFAVLLKFVADIDRSLPVLFLDTLWLFKETLAYKRRARRPSRIERSSHYYAVAKRAGAARSKARSVFPRSQCLLRVAQGCAARARTRRIRRLDQRTQALSRRRAVHARRCRGRGASSEIQSAGPAHRRRVECDFRGGGPAAPSP